jgi:hypothetical protein
MGKLTSLAPLVEVASYCFISSRNPYSGAFKWETALLKYVIWKFTSCMCFIIVVLRT